MVRGRIPLTLGRVIERSDSDELQRDGSPYGEDESVQERERTT